ncbi:phosphoglycerate kinase [[Pseudomonas] carboxydohydrogena]|uniref:Phosphoglycerate kinase n=1 Tax=Afipia carboxydohydrogena TaxID=290 RepID=A0ABY8BQ20_AFICR|nr:phosphoglycerate kinase [[Pseudomonas] carboxydohydrogena]WEF51066.1 phosphoglycerate kinase [[Pseudomonas] carboxydohydrogena]
MADLRTLDGLDLAGKRVVVRADLNVPMNRGMVSDDTRIRCLVPTLNELAEKGASVVVLSHFGRPDGKPVAEFSLEPLRGPLEALAGRPVRFVSTDWTDSVPVSRFGRIGEIVLMENTRFHPGEEANDPAFARRLANLGDIFVNDAFSVSHRAHASTEGIARLLPSYAGRCMEAELAALDKALGNPIRPIGAVIGGAKISTKLAILENLVKRTDILVVGGGMANTLLYAGGKEIGRSICEPQLCPVAERILQQASEHGCTIVLPTDVVIADKFAPGAAHATVNVDDVPADSMILDIGPDTVAAVAEKFSRLKTLLWNGPLGAFEVEPFGKGTFALANAAARLTQTKELLTVAGGGDTLAALSASGAIDDFSYVSAAGGAFLEWLEGRELPGVEVLRTNSGTEV